MVPLSGRAGQTLTLVARVSNLSRRPFPAQASYGRRLVRLGAQLCDADGRVTNRDHARAWLPHTLEPGESLDVPIEVSTPESPGHYAVKLDLVSEGIDWFEACGSQTTTPSVARVVSPAKGSAATAQRQAASTDVTRDVRGSLAATVAEGAASGTTEDSTTRPRIGLLEQLLGEARVQRVPSAMRNQMTDDRIPDQRQVRR